MIDFNPLLCPNCKKKAARAWELFFLFSPFMIKGQCRHCGKYIKINYNTLKWILISFVSCFIIGNIIKFIFLIKFILFDISFMIIFILLPFLLGKRLFILR